MHFIHAKVVILILFCSLVLTESKPTDSSSKKFRSYVKYLLNQMGINNEYTNFLSFMKIYPPEDVQMKVIYNKFFSYDSYLSDMTDVYAKYYTLSDIVQLINFYTSPLGKKTLAVSHEINKNMEAIMYNKISDYIFTASEHGFDIVLPQIPF